MIPSSFFEKLASLPEEKRLEVFDFVDYLASRFSPQLSDWADANFSQFLVVQALRDMEGEPDLYTEADIKEHWLWNKRATLHLPVSRKLT